MLDPKFIENNPDEVVENLRRRDVHGDMLDNLPLATHVRRFARAEQDRRELVTARDTLRGRANNLAKDIGAAYKTGDTETAERLKAEVAYVKGEIKEAERCIGAIAETWSLTPEFYLYLPNMLAHDVPEGHTEADNVELSRWIPPGMELRDGGPNHIELGEKFGLFDFDRGARLAGSGFSVLTNVGARLERALVNFCLDRNTAAGYVEMKVPHIVHEHVVEGTGQLPKFEGDMYRAGNGYLIPTGEVPLTNLHRDEIMGPDALPKAYTAATQCFRREAGSHGALERGLIRQHEFTKVELVRIERAEDAGKAFEAMVERVCYTLRWLGLPYRTVLLCAGDTGFSAAKTIDIEVWLPSQSRWMEVSSVSWCAEFQARRMNTRYRPEEGAKPVFAHTINGSCLPTGRILVAALEHWTNHDTDLIEIPTALQSYLG